MEKQGKVAMVSAFVLVALVVLSIALGARGRPQCNDGIDNDQDGLIDYPADTGCDSKKDNLESTDNCTDSDGGVNTQIKGTMSGVLNNTLYSYTDACSSSIDLDEHHCSGTRPYHSDFICTLAPCIDGASAIQCQPN